MSYPTHNAAANPVVSPQETHSALQSPQITGATEPYSSAPRETIESQPTGMESISPPTYVNAQGGGNEKSAAYGAHQQPYAEPQQGYPQQQPNIQQHTPAQPKNNYQMATPLASLQQSPAPVDCPACGVREMTNTSYASGGTTQ